MSGQVCTFRVGELTFALDVLLVQEVLRHQPITRVPLAPPVLRGLINLRGHVLTAFDLRTRLGLPPADDPEGGMNIVALTPAGPISLLVDQVGDVITIDESQIEPSPAHLQEPIRSAIAGIYKLPDQLLLLLDLSAISLSPHHPSTALIA